MSKRPRSPTQRKPTKASQIRLHYGFIVDELAAERDFIAKSMFGCLAIYLGPRVVMVLANGAEPWNGILLPTEKTFHVQLTASLGASSPHPVLKKWLYWSQTSDNFERLAGEIVERIKRHDPLIGVEKKTPLRARPPARGRAK